jgi:hypothetical protein
MSGGDTPRVQTFEMVAIASRKLTRKTGGEFERVLVSRTTYEIIAIMTAILACRLALYTGSYVQLTHELLAFHMMNVKWSPQTWELHAHYPSEPILSEASVERCIVIGAERDLIDDGRSPEYILELALLATQPLRSKLRC